MTVRESPVATSPRVPPPTHLFCDLADTGNLESMLARPADDIDPVIHVAGLPGTLATDPISIAGTRAATVIGS